VPSSLSVVPCYFSPQGNGETTYPMTPRLATVDSRLLRRKVHGSPQCKM
jgi:hypothetical protein